MKFKSLIILAATVGAVATGLVFDNSITAKAATTQASTNTMPSKQATLIAFAKEQVGKPCAAGAAGPNQFDASGLVQYVFENSIHMTMPRSSVAQEKIGKDVPLNQLQAGDLLFWGNKGASYNVAIYLGSGNGILVPGPGHTVTIESLKYYMPSFAKRVLTAADTQAVAIPSLVGETTGEQFVFRMYNPNSGLHHYTSNLYEARHLQQIGWNYESVGWTAPTTGTPVYRVYNPNNGMHHYTTNAAEVQHLVSVGWNDEGVAWQSGSTKAVYRVYNPNSGEHHYTTNAAEKNHLVSVGWNDEGIGWYALK